MCTAKDLYLAQWTMRECKRDESELGWTNNDRENYSRRWRNLMLSSATAGLLSIKRMQNSFLLNPHQQQEESAKRFSLNAFLLHPVKRTKFDIIMFLTFIQLDANHKRLKPFFGKHKAEQKTCWKIKLLFFAWNVNGETRVSSLPPYGFA